MYIDYCPFSHTARDLGFYIDGALYTSNSTATECKGERLLIGCAYRSTIRQQDVRMSDTAGNHIALRGDPSITLPFFDVLSYTIPASAAVGDRTFLCIADPQNIVVRVTFHFVEPTGKKHDIVHAGLHVAYYTTCTCTCTCTLS